MIIEIVYFYKYLEINSKEDNSKEIECQIKIARLTFFELKNVFQTDIIGFKN